MNLSYRFYRHATLAVVALGVSAVLSGCASPLYCAARDGNVTEAKQLIDSGANVNDTEYPPLTVAAETGNTAVAELLLNHGADVSLSVPPDGNTPLLRAAANGQTASAALLLNHGAKIYERNIPGNTALMEAAAGNHVETMKLLLDRGADPGAANRQGWPALQFAADHGATDAARLLLDRGVEIDARNTFGFTALLIAAAHGHADTVQLLLVRGADIDAIDPDWKQTALHWATVNGHADVAAVLLQYGVDVNARNIKGYTAFQGAEIYDRPEIARLIGNTPPSYREQLLKRRQALYRNQNLPRLLALPLDQLIQQNELDDDRFVALQTEVLLDAAQRRFPAYLSKAEPAEREAIRTAISIQLQEAQSRIDRLRREASEYLRKEREYQAAACRKSAAGLITYQSALKDIRLLANRYDR